MPFKKETKPNLNILFVPYSQTDSFGRFFKIPIYWLIILIDYSHKEMNRMKEINICVSRLALLESNLCPRLTLPDISNMIHWLTFLNDINRKKKWKIRILHKDLLQYSILVIFARVSFAVHFIEKISHRLLMSLNAVFVYVISISASQVQNDLFIICQLWLRFS